MSEPEVISLDKVEKSDVAVCPECGILFVKSVKGETKRLLGKTGFYCPVCESFVVREE